MSEHTFQRVENLFNTPEYLSRKSELQEISDFCMPGYQNFTTSVDTVHTQKRDIDNSPAIYNKELATTVFNGLVSPGTKWLKITLKDGQSSSDEKIMLENLSNTVLEEFTKSGSTFSSQFFSVIESTTAFGLGTLGVGYSSKKGIIFKAVPISQIALAENFEGDIDTVARKFKMTVRQVRQMWPDIQHEAILRQEDKNPDKEIEIIHCVWPENGKYLYQYISLEYKIILDQYTEKHLDFINFRWAKHSGEIYGHGQGKVALGFMRSSTRARKMMVEGLVKSVRPTLLASEDIKDLTNQRNNSSIRLKAGQIIPGGLEDGQEKVRPIPAFANLQAGQETYKTEINSLERAFFIDKIRLPQDSTRRTAFEVAAMQREEIKYLSPFISNLELSLKEAIMAVISILKERGKLSEFDVDIKDLDVEIVSPLARQLKMEDARAILTFVQMSSQILPLAPEAAGRMDGDDMIKIVAEATGIPETALKSDEEFEQFRLQQQQAAQLQQQQQQADISKTASEATKNIGGQFNE